MKTYFNHLYLHIHFLKYFLQTIFRINSFGCCRKSRSRRVYDRFESRCWQNWSSKDWNIDDSPRCLFSGKLCFFGCFPSRCRKIRAKYLLIFLLHSCNKIRSILWNFDMQQRWFAEFFSLASRLCKKGWRSTFYVKILIIFYALI